MQYTTKEAAEVAISQMNGTVIAGVKVRCAWGRSAAVRAAATSGGASGYYQQYPNYQQTGYQVGLQLIVCAASLVVRLLITIATSLYRTTTGIQATTSSSNISKAQATVVDTRDTVATTSRDLSSKADISSKEVTATTEVTTATTATTTKSPATLLALMMSNP